MLANSYTLAVMAKNVTEGKITVSTRITRTLLDQLQAIANEDDRKLAYMIEKAIKELVERYNGQKAKRRS